MELDIAALGRARGAHRPAKNARGTHSHEETAVEAFITRFVGAITGLGIKVTGSRRKFSSVG
jgi:hypothetical protein